MCQRPTPRSHAAQANVHQGRHDAGNAKTAALDAAKTITCSPARLLTCSVRRRYNNHLLTCSVRRGRNNLLFYCSTLCCSVWMGMSGQSVSTIKLSGDAPQSPIA